MTGTRYTHNVFLRRLFSEDIKRARASLGFTQVEIADILGVPAGTYGAWETLHTRDRDLLMQNLLRLCDEFGLVVTDYFDTYYYSALEMEPDTESDYADFSPKDQQSPPWDE